jgi:hypothetical protein
MSNWHTVLVDDWEVRDEITWERKHFDTFELAEKARMEWQDKEPSHYISIAAVLE